MPLLGALLALLSPTAPVLVGNHTTVEAVAHPHLPHAIPNPLPGKGRDRPHLVTSPLGRLHAVDICLDLGFGQMHGPGLLKHKLDNRINVKEFWMTYLLLGPRDRLAGAGLSGTGEDPVATPEGGLCDRKLSKLLNLLVIKLEPPRNKQIGVSGLLVVVIGGIQKKLREGQVRVLLHEDQDFCDHKLSIKSILSITVFKYRVEDLRV